MKSNIKRALRFWELLDRAKITGTDGCKKGGAEYNVLYRDVLLALRLCPQQIDRLLHMGATLTRLHTGRSAQDPAHLSLARE